MLGLGSVRWIDLSTVAWNGLDTLAVVAGVSALQPLMVLAGVNDAASSASAAGIQHTVDVAAAATAGNYTGPMVAAVTFVRFYLLD